METNKLFDLTGKTTAEGKTLETIAEVTQYLLNEAGLAIVPFYAFGASKKSTWYRLSVGTSVYEEIDELFKFFYYFTYITSLTAFTTSLAFGNHSAKRTGE